MQTCISHTPTQVISARVTLPGSWTAAISSQQSVSVSKNPKSDSFSRSRNINRLISDLRGKRSEELGSLELSPASFTSSEGIGLTLFHYSFVFIFEYHTEKKGDGSEKIKNKRIVLLALALDSCKKKQKTTKCTN